jgi:hypothetical protein
MADISHVISSQDERKVKLGMGMGKGELPERRRSEYICVRRIEGLAKKRIYRIHNTYVVGYKW